jgi:starch-binding outer membrane protein, SusD/RagB family
MKINRLKSLFVSCGVVAGGLIIFACQKSFLDVAPTGNLGDSQVATLKGSEQLLIGAYSMLDKGDWAAAGSNWVYGSICGGDANKGSNEGDQADAVPVQQYIATPSNGYFNAKWRNVYEGITRTNNTIRAVTAIPAGGITEAAKNRILGESRFLRGHYHFEAKKMWDWVPYVDEKITYADGNFNVPNDVQIWDKIEADLKFAFDNLPEGTDAGRANKWAAASYLAKAYMFQRKYAEALPLLNRIIAEGKTANGKKYGLLAKFGDNFRPAFNNNEESVFAYQASINDGSGGQNANFGQILNFPYNGGPGGCCGFHQPSFELTNSFRTSAKGLPLLDGSYNNPSNELKTDMSLLASDSFTPDAGNLDPRLDLTVGRRGLPYLDWGNHPGVAWIRDQSFGGPYAPRKNVFAKSEQEGYTDGSSWTRGLTGTNYVFIRFADVLLMAAECEVETGSLDQARTYVDQVRARASNPAGMVTVEGKPAAKYTLNTYASVKGSSEDPFTNKDNARTAVRFERKLELAMEGHRFFDLVRWQVADQAIKAFIDYEKGKLTPYNKAQFTKGKNEYFPIPQRQIDLMGGALKQKYPF